jgi:hypothetical protein
MDGSMKENMRMIRSMALVNSNGQMEKSMKELGLTESSMERGYLLVLEDRRRKVCGYKVEENVGL